MADQDLPCPVTSTEQLPLTVEPTQIISLEATPTIKVPVVLAEPTLQIVLESTITLNPAATEIKRVVKNVFLNQVKLVPVAFKPIHGTDFFKVTRAKLFVAGHIRKNIEYASAECNGALQDRIADVPFSGFADIKTFLTKPILGVSEDSKTAFLNEQNGLVPRLDKFFFQNLVKYNEQPFGELVAANFFEVDFSPVITSPEGSFSTITEKIVLDLTVKVLQTQQLKLNATQQITVPPQGTVGS
ncbi:Uracil permease [Cytobacillus depressus]|uniref:Uracil permease n=1 Tax=Cytobacillus depressus TaxID=1602942 RepID=A0A6L3UZR5_9BACI|nr:Uracil permease [Cytobacillus depressus]KAB2330004.1 Uracil permease [Cytobacillus depressus]